MNEVEWIKINNFENYLVSSCGKIKNSDSDKILKPQLTKTGYYQIGLCKNSKVKNYKIHRLVYEAFINKINDNYQINHIDSNRLNNSLLNLELVTNRENQYHRLNKNHKFYCIGITTKKQKQKSGKIDIYYQATIIFNNKTHTKNSKNLDDAIKWRKEKEIEFNIVNVKYINCE